MNKTAKSSASKRVASLLDENSFVEIGGSITARSTDFNLSAADAPSDGVITGYGVIDSSLVYVYSQDASVLGGSVGEMHARKIAALYDMALKMGAPVIGLIDCAGLRLQEATDALNAFGEIYRKQALASGVIPQITAVFGNCGGGMAVAAGLSDFTFMESEKAKLFVNSPNALEGNTADKNDTSCSTFQSEKAGNVDFVGTEKEILAGIRQLVSLLPENNEDNSYAECTDDLNRSIADISAVSKDAAAVLTRIADGNLFMETKAAYAKDMVTGFLRLNGQTVGAVANREAVLDESGKPVETFGALLSADGCEKAAAFVRFCDAFEIPVLTLTNAEGYKADLENEKRIAKAAASLTYEFASATVAKVNLITGKAFGNAFNVMNSKACGADFTYAWEGAKVGLMDSKLAAKIIYADKEGKEILEKAKEFEEIQSGVLSAARRGYVDTVIAPEDTRKYLIGAFEMLFSKNESIPAKKHGAV